MRKLPVLIALLGGVFAAPVAFAQTLPPIQEARPAQDGAQSRVLLVQPEQSALAYVQPQPGVERIGVEAALSRPDGRYAVGELVDLRVRVDRPSHIVALNIGPDGSVTQLYPNAFNPDRRLFPEEALAVPGQGAVIRVAPPVGRELIKIIASEHPMPLASMADFRQVGPFLATQAGAAEAVARRLVVQAEPAPPPRPLPAPALAGAPPAFSPTLAPLSPPAPESSASVGVWGEKLLAIETYEAAAPLVAEPFPSVPVAGFPGFGASGFTLATDKPHYRIGEQVRFQATTDRPCHLTLLALSPAGGSAVIFPLSPTDLRRIVPGGPVEIPGAAGAILTVNGPERQETVIGLCASADEPMVAGGAGLTAPQSTLRLAQNAPFQGPAPGTAEASVSYLVTR